MKNETELTQLRDQRNTAYAELEAIGNKYTDEGSVASEEDIQRSEQLEATITEIDQRIQTLELCEKAKAFASTGKSEHRTSTSQFVRSKSGPTVKDRNDAFKAWALTGIASKKIKDSWKRSADLCDIDLGSNQWIVRDQTSDVDAEGGYATNDSLHQKLVEAMADVGGLSSVCELVPSENGNDMHFSINNDLASSAAISAQAESVSSTGLLYSKKTLKAYTTKTSVWPVSLEMFDDVGFDVAAHVGNALGLRLQRNISNLIVNGGGDLEGEPEGLLDVVNASATGLSNNLFLENLEELYSSVNSYYKRNAVWVMNDDTFSYLMFNLLDQSDRPLFWSSANSLSDGPSYMLLGKRVVIDPSYPSMEKGQMRLPITFGDHSYHKYRVVGSPVIIKDTSRFVDNLSVGFFAYQRFGSCYVNPGNHPVQALKTGVLSGD